MPDREIIPPTKLGWLAGVLATRGKTKMVEAPSRAGKPFASLYVETGELMIVKELCRLTGTQGAYRDSVLPVEWDKRGCAEHCPEPHIHVEREIRQTGRWHVSGIGAAIVIYNVLPYLLEGQEFTERAHGLMTAALDRAPKRYTRGRHAIEETIRRLESLGWMIPPGLKLPRSEIVRAKEARAEHLRIRPGTRPTKS